MEKFSLRTKLTVKWSTLPGDVGYGEKKSDWTKMSGQVMGVRRAISYRKEIDEMIGQNVFRAIKYFYKGREITDQEFFLIKNIVNGSY